MGLPGLGVEPQKVNIVPGLHRLPHLHGVNSYLWRPGDSTHAEEGPILFDCGHPWSGREIAASLAALDCRPADIRTIAITHADFDHVGRLAALAAANHADIVAHVAEAPLLRSARWRALPGGDTLPDPVILATGVLYRLWPLQPTEVTRPVRDGEEIGGGWVAVHTPGHTPGHTAYFHPQTRALIAGDALGSVRKGRMRVPKRTYAADWDDALASVRRLAALEPSVICFGHGREQRDPAALLKQLMDALEHVKT